MLPGTELVVGEVLNVDTEFGASGDVEANGNAVEIRLSDVPVVDTVTSAPVQFKLLALKVSKEGYVGGSLVLGP